MIFYQQIICKKCKGYYSYHHHHLHHCQHHDYHDDQVEHHLASAANAMLEAWNATNQAFTTRSLISTSSSFSTHLRIAECSEVHSKLQAHFSLNLQEMYDLGKHINNIKNAIR